MSAPEERHTTENKAPDRRGSTVERRAWLQALALLLATAPEFSAERATQDLGAIARETRPVGSRVPRGWRVSYHLLTVEIPHFALERRTLLGIKERAEPGQAR